MHVALRGIITKDSIDHNGLFSIVDSVSIVFLLYHLQCYYLSVNHPLGLNQAFVCVGPGGMRKKDATPTLNVNNPSCIFV